LLDFVRYRLSPRGRPIKVRVKGFDLFVRRGSADLTAAIECLSGEFSCLKNLYDKNWRGIIVDAGGYIGTAAIAMSEIYKNAKVVTIEPRPENYELLKKNVKFNSNIMPLNGVLSSAVDDNVDLFDRKNNDWGWSIISLSGDEHGDRIPVKNFTVPDLINEYGKIGILKLDIEGAEKSLFDEVKELKDIDAVFVELHDSIVEGCTGSFEKFSEGRQIKKDKGEKCLSLKKN
jgi:FkbM family methyltransferase